MRHERKSALRSEYSEKGCDVRSIDRPCKKIMSSDIFKAALTQFKLLQAA